ncbi:dUTPase [Klebsiella phage vB_KpM_FBKp24]|uniref:dUTP diphosphatase n=1 Tax=Klebsiella phage vB_KpM_FBKp24 TaxID=2801834 RepID=A0A7U0GBJ7_9CAUD|nr:dUTPase [Klebsiella phage vB_KpM_FBKp24]QQV92145.1 deoxyuridine 5'-triphosphate nucleotidohydrolase [Klebsiella phage vB_KpM_FBKp24]
MSEPNEVLRYFHTDAGGIVHHSQLENIVDAVQRVRLGELDPRNFVAAEIIYHDPRYENEWGKLDYATPGSAAVDLRAAIDAPVVLNPGECKMISSGVAIHLNNPNFMLNTHPRSGLGYKNGIVLGNLTGVIDSDYTGTIGIPLWNRSDVPFTVNPGDRISQLVVVPVWHLALKEVKSFSASSERGDSGWGSSGVK